MITAGHQRKKAAVTIGLEYLPCIRIKSPNLQDEILFNLMHNSIETSKTSVRLEDFKVGEYHYCTGEKIKIESEPKDVAEFLKRLGIGYGKYHFDNLGVKTYHQFLTQLKRLNTNGRQLAKKVKSWICLTNGLNQVK